MSLLRVLSPAKSFRTGGLRKPRLSASATVPQQLSFSFLRAVLPETWATSAWMAERSAPYPLLSTEGVEETIGSEWPGGTLRHLFLQLRFLASLRWVWFTAASHWQTDAKQIADMYHSLQIRSFSLILIPTHKHFSYIHWLHYHCRSVITKLKGRIVIQFNLGKIFK